MKLIVGMDDDGHFFAVPTTDRDRVWEILTEELRGGDTWANRSDFCDEEYSDNLNYKAMTEEAWLEMIESFEQRGQMEIILVK